MEPRIARRRWKDERAKHAFRFARADDNLRLQARSSRAERAMEPRIARRRLEGRRSETRFSFRESGRQPQTPSAILASGASNGTQDRAPTIGGTKERNTLFVSRERTTTSDSKRDPRERSEQWNPESRADD